MKKNILLGLTAAVAMSAAMVSCGNNGNPANLKPKTQLDSVAFAIGVLNGQRYAGIDGENAVFPKTTLDMDYVMAGFELAARQDSVHLKLTPMEAQALCQRYFQSIIDEEKAKGKEFMSQNSGRDGVQSLESGLQIETLVEGTGNQPKAGDQVKVNYKGTLVDGTVFDQNDSIVFDTRRVKPGFSEGLLNMKEGGKAILTMPSDLAYGDNGSQVIPGGATLQFEVELLEVIPAPEADPQEKVIPDF